MSDSLKELEDVFDKITTEDCPVFLKRAKVKYRNSSSNQRTVKLLTIPMYYTDLFEKPYSFKPFSKFDI